MAQLTRDGDMQWAVTRYVDHAGTAFFRVLPTATARTTSFDILAADWTRDCCRGVLASIAHETHRGEWTPSDTLVVRTHLVGIAWERHVSVAEQRMEEAAIRSQARWLIDLAAPEDVV
jgi:hypothetical protein